jgi:hypothetical protein
MALNLIRLIWASSRSGAAGQSMRNHVNNPPLPDGVGMTDYLITALATSGNIPLPPAEITYEGSELFNITNTITRNTRGYLIQRNDAAAYSFVTTGPSMPTVSVETLNVVSSGAQHQIGLRVNAPFAGTAGVIGATSRPVAEPNYGDPLEQWPVRWFATATTAGTDNPENTSLLMTYAPDAGGFNPSLGNGQFGWTFRQKKRMYQISDLDFQWWLTTYNGSTWVRAGSFPISTQTEFSTTNGAPAVGLFFNNNTPVTDNMYGTNSLAPIGRAWLEWRVKGTTTWITAGRVDSDQDPRPAQ